MSYHPRLMPDGSQVLIDDELMYKLHYGDPTKGWEGDERLALSFNGETQCLELWRHCEDAEYRLIVQGKPGMRVAHLGLIDFLVTHDRNRGYDAAEAAIQKELARKKEAQAQMDDVVGEAAERLYYGLKRDIGAYEGGSTRDLMTLPEAPWKKDNDSSGDSR